MLISCPECKRDVSDQATSCPHCGHPIKGTTDSAHAIANQTTLAPEATVKKTPVLALLATIALVMALGAPRFLVFLPLMITLGLAIGSIFRREKGRPWSVLVVIAAVGVFILSNIDPAAIRAATPARTVTYSVEGSASIVSFTYRNGQGGTEQGQGAVPWSRSITAKEGDFLYISAQNQSEYGDLVVRITVDGQEVKRSSSSGRYSIASASGNCCNGD